MNKNEDVIKFQVPLDSVYMILSATLVSFKTDLKLKDIKSSYVILGHIDEPILYIDINGEEYSVSRFSSKSDKYCIVRHSDTSMLFCSDKASHNINHLITSAIKEKTDG